MFLSAFCFRPRDSVLGSSMSVPRCRKHAARYLARVREVVDAASSGTLSHLHAALDSLTSATWVDNSVLTRAHNTGLVKAILATKTTLIWGVVAGLVLALCVRHGHSRTSRVFTQVAHRGALQRAATAPSPGHGPRNRWLGAPLAAASIAQAGPGVCAQSQIGGDLSRVGTWDELRALYPTAKRRLDREEALSGARLAALQSNQCPKEHRLIRSEFAKTCVQRNAVLILLLCHSMHFGGRGCGYCGINVTEQDRWCCELCLYYVCVPCQKKHGRSE